MGYFNVTGSLLYHWGWVGQQTDSEDWCMTSNTLTQQLGERHVGTALGQSLWCVCVCVCVCACVWRGKVIYKRTNKFLEEILYW